LGLLLIASCSQTSGDGNDDPASLCLVRSKPLWDMDLRDLEVQAWPGDSDYQTALTRGVALFRQGRFLRASANFETAAELAPDCPEPLLLSGRAQVEAVRSGEVGQDAPKAGKATLQDAVATFDRALLRDPDLADAYRYKAQALFAASTANPLKLPIDPPAPILKTLTRALELEPEHTGTERFFIEVASAYAKALLSLVQTARDQENDNPARALAIILLNMRITDYYLKTFMRDAAARNETYLEGGDPRSLASQISLLSYLAEFDEAEAVFQKYGGGDQESPIPVWRQLMTEARQPLQVKSW